MQTDSKQKKQMAFSALRNPDFRLLWFGACISFVGSWLQIIAMGLLVYNKTHSKEMLGWIGFAGTIPNTLLMLFGGAIADRSNKRNLVIGTQTMFALNAVILAYLSWSDLLQMYHLVILSLINGITFSIDGPARQALIYLIVGKEDLASGIALQSAAFNLARIIGPLIATLLYSKLGPAVCFFLNGLSFLAVLAAIFWIKTDLTQKEETTGTVWLGLAEGIRHLRSNSLMRSVVSLTAVTSLTAFSVYSTLMPAFSAEKLHIPEADTRYGYLFGALGAGAILGAYLVGKFAARKRSGLLMIMGAMTFSITLFLVGFATNYFVALTLFLIIGIAAVSQLATANSLTQKLAPESLRGRAVSVHMFAMAGTQAFGAIFAGRTAQLFGISFSLCSGAAILFFFTVGVILFRRSVLDIE